MTCEWLFGDEEDEEWKWDWREREGLISTLAFEAVAISLVLELYKVTVSVLAQVCKKNKKRD